MSSAAKFYDTTYSRFAQDVLAQVRQETYDTDIGQNSWLTEEEYRLFWVWLGLSFSSHVLEIASGSGGPALFLARNVGCTLIGVDVNPNGVKTAQAQAEAIGLNDRVQFQEVDASRSLPFPDKTFDAVLCIDSINHLNNRARVLQEWARVLRDDGRLLYTDPIVVTGILTNQEIAIRSSIGFFLFTPLGENERLVRAAGFELEKVEDRTENVAFVAQRWHAARERHAEALRKIEGDQPFESFQKFFAVTDELARERRLSRFVFVAKKPLSQ